MEIGIGFGKTIEFISQKQHNPSAVDISPIALERIKSIAKTYLVYDMKNIEENSIDIAYSFLVFQHCNDEMLEHIIQYSLRALKKNGDFSFQIATGKYEDLPEEYKKRKEDNIEFCDRDIETVKTIIKKYNGEIIEPPDIIYHKNFNFYWHILKVSK
jgi:cyclopropane fatty-acyl-phospholipid synthase-like methyltransferase